jgi:hypothetical protein
MKKTVLTFGLISGAISSVMMLLTLPFMDRIGYDRGEIIGYSVIVLSFLLVFFGVRSYRDNVAGGTLSFGRALAVGLLITLVSCACYVATWQFVYHKLTPGFLDKYSAHLIEKERAAGATPEQLQATAQRMEEFKRLYQNPLVNIAFTFLEPFPVGFLVSLISAAVLRRRAGPGFAATASMLVR